MAQTRRKRGVQVDNSSLIRIIQSFPIRGSKTWLAQQIGISPQRLYRYEKSRDQAPEWIVEKATRAVIKAQNSIHL